MKRTLCLWILATGVLGWAAAQDATTVLVAPSDQIKYPDPAQVLNKTETAPKPTAHSASPVAGVPTTHPLATSTPVPAAPASPSPSPETPAPASPAPGVPGSSAHGWFLKWTLTGDEAGAQSWVKTLGVPASLQPVSTGVWEAWAGPLDPASLKTALKGQGGLATLVHR